MVELKPKLLVVAGPDGVGKTTTTSQILNEWVEGCAYINADFMVLVGRTHRFAPASR